MPKRIIFPNKGEVVLAHFELPSLGPKDVRIRTKYSLMSIGTELTILNQRYDPNTHFAKRFTFPQLKTGIQAVGKVEEIGTEVNNYKVGDHVFMRMAHGSHQVIPASECTIIPGTVNLKEACWCGLAKTAFRAAWAGKFETLEQVLIIGAGPVGQMTVRWAKAFSTNSILVNDVSAFRLELATDGGATNIFSGEIESQVACITKNNRLKESQVVVDTTGNPEVLKHALSIAPMFGKIVILGDTGYPSQQCLNSDFMSKGLSLQAVHDSHDLDGWDQKAIDQKFFSLLTNCDFNLSGLITHEFSPEECLSAYRVAQDYKENVMGILYDWSTLD